MSKEFFKAVDSKIDVPMEKIYKIMDVLVTQIQQHGGEWTASISTLIDMVETDNHQDEIYGIYLHALDLVAKNFNIKWHRAGRSGRRYYIAPSDLAKYLSDNRDRENKIVITHNITITCSHCQKPTNYILSLTPKG